MSDPTLSPFNPLRQPDKCSIDLEFQGCLVQMHINQPVRVGPGGGLRKTVTKFSAASRRRLMKKFARLDVKDGGVFITLTYPADFPSPRRAKVHLKAFFERLRRFAPGCSGVWRMEFQDRGAPHFHIFMFNLPFLEKLELQRWWGEIIGYDNVFTRIEKVLSRRRIMLYVSKYVAKSSPESGFNLDAYLHAGEFVHPITGEISGPIGRWWGSFQTNFLPFAELVKLIVNNFTIAYQFRRGARHVWHGVGDRRSSGFALFVGDARRWLDYWFAVCMEAA